MSTAPQPLLLPSRSARAGGLAEPVVAPTPARVTRTVPGRALVAKHVLDFVLALVVLVVLAPLLVGLALAVKLSSPGPVLFRQHRVGRDGRSFEILKFRSMRLAPAATTYHVATGVAPGGVEGVDRRTRVGRLMRSTSMDELPQLVNVLRGEMSLVGPRPERPEFVELFADEVPGYADRHRMRVGVTGLAQVNGLRGQSSIALRVAADNEYIESWTIRRDLILLARTVRVVLAGGGE